MPEFATYLLERAADVGDVRERLDVVDAISLDGTEISVGTIGGRSAVSVQVGRRTFLAVLGDSSEFVAEDAMGVPLDLVEEVLE